MASGFGDSDLTGMVNITKIMNFFPNEYIDVFMSEKGLVIAFAKREVIIYAESSTSWEGLKTLIVTEIIKQKNNPHSYGKKFFTLLEILKILHRVPDAKMVIYSPSINYFHVIVYDTGTVTDIPIDKCWLIMKTFINENIAKTKFICPICFSEDAEKMKITCGSCQKDYCSHCYDAIYKINQEIPCPHCKNPNGKITLEDDIKSKLQYIIANSTQ